MKLLRGIFLSLCLFASAISFSQNKRQSELDSLLKILRLSKGELEVDNLNRAAIIYFENQENSEVSSTFAERALKASEKINYRKGIAQSYLTMARLKDNEDILDSIKYAQRIQKALMPTDGYIDKSVKRLKQK